MHANDLNAWPGPQGGNGATGGFARGHSKVADPNAFNEWTDPSEIKTDGRVERQIDKILTSEELRCEKCGWKTRVQETYRTHMRADSAGLILCERERKKFAESQRGALDQDALEKNISASIEKAMSQGFIVLAEAIAARLGGDAPKKRGRAKKGKKHELRAAGGVRGEAATGGTEPVGEVESEDQPLADPPAGPAETE